MAPTRYLIVNADDFGLSPGINRGIVEAHTRGIVTSTSLMVRWPAAREAAALMRDYPDLGAGLHLDFGEWVFRNGAWEQVYEVVDLGSIEAVHEEVDRQLARFEELAGRRPTHLDSHQHVHLDEPLRSVAAAVAERLGIPLRRYTPGIHYCGDFYGQTGEGVAIPEYISVDSLIRVLAALPEGVTELACHPGFADGLNSTYLNERREELRALCDPRVCDALREAGVELRSFTDWARSGSSD